MKNYSPFQVRTVKDKSKEMAKIKNLGPKRLKAQYESLLDEYNQLHQESGQKINKYQTVFNLNPDSLFVINLKGFVTEANISAIETTGFGKEEIIGRHFFQLPFIPVIKLKHFLRLFIGIRQGNIQTLKNFEWVHKSGELHYSDIFIRLLHDAEGKPDGFMIVVPVITQENNKEQLLNDTRQGSDKLIKETTADTELRQKAEDFLKKKLGKTDLQKYEEESLKTIHQLEVYQVELEMQNEELRQAKMQADIATQKYIELFDFAPVGYFTLSKIGEILELNLKGAKMLGKEHSRLLNSRFGFFISEDSKPVFNHFLEQIFRKKNIETCELIITNNGNPPLPVYVSGIITPNENQCLVNVIDITEKKQAERDLIQSQENYQIIFEGVEDGIMLLDTKLKIINVNNPLTRIVGISKKKLIGKSAYDLAKKIAYRNQLPFLVDYLQDIKQNESAKYVEFYFQDKILEILTKKQYSGQRVVMIRDITEKKSLEESKIKGLKRDQILLSLFQKTHDLKEKDIIRIAIEEMTKLLESELGFIGFLNEDNTMVTAHLWTKKEMKDSNADNKSVQISIKEGDFWSALLKRKKIIVENEYSAIKIKKGLPEGHVPIRRFMSIPITQNGKVVMTCALANKADAYNEEEILQTNIFMEGLWSLITNKRAEEKLLQSEKNLRKEVKLRTLELITVNNKLKKELAIRKASQKNLKQSILDLKNLNTYVQKVREDEQLKIARLIHDDIAQLLTSLKMELAMYKKKAGTFNYSDSDSLDTLINLLDQSTNAVTNIITKLRPVILDNMGLIPALEWLFHNFQKHTGIIIDFRIKGDYFLENGDKSISIYRVVEELLNNIRLHSKASYVMIKLSGNYSGFSISIKDNGIGITEENISNPFSFGIMGMKERITALNGSITFKGIPEKGTTIYIKIPMK